MASYRLFIKRSAARELESVGSKKDRRRLVARIRSLADDPSSRLVLVLVVGVAQRGRRRVDGGVGGVTVVVGGGEATARAIVAGEEQVGGQNQSQW